jgi:hypothetical protein
MHAKKPRRVCHDEVFQDSQVVLSPFEFRRLSKQHFFLFEPVDAEC